MTNNLYCNLDDQRFGTSLNDPQAGIAGINCSAVVAQLKMGKLDRPIEANLTSLDMDMDMDMAVPY